MYQKVTHNDIEEQSEIIESNNNDSNSNDESTLNTEPSSKLHNLYNFFNKSFSCLLSTCQYGCTQPCKSCYHYTDQKLVLRKHLASLHAREKERHPGDGYESVSLFSHHNSTIIINNNNNTQHSFVNDDIDENNNNNNNENNNLISNITQRMSRNLYNIENNNNNNTANNMVFMTYERMMDIYHNMSTSKTPPTTRTNLDYVSIEQQKINFMNQLAMAEKDYHQAYQTNHHTNLVKRICAFTSTLLQSYNNTKTTTTMVNMTNSTSHQNTIELYLSVRGCSFSNTQFSDSILLSLFPTTTLHINNNNNNNIPNNIIYFLIRTYVNKSVSYDDVI